MATKTTTLLVDDLTGAELQEGRGETLAFALEGQHYEIDLGPETANELRGLLTPYIAAGRRLGRGEVPKKNAVSGEQAAARAWLTEQGIDVPARGRIAAELMERYRKR